MLVLLATSVVMCNYGEKINLKPWLVSHNDFDGGKICL